jgi:ADP-ribose pyrophosphatase YjhB (NUDIX family)
VIKHVWRYSDRTVTYTWLGSVDKVVARVYALAYTHEGTMLLVGGAADAGYWLPGGGVEVGESPEAALTRELMEEAAATPDAMERIGVQQVDDPLTGRHYQSFFWCRVSLKDVFVPEHEITERLLVPPEQFLDILPWGREDPKGEILVHAAASLNQAFQSGPN